MPILASILLASLARLPKIGEPTTLESLSELCRKFGARCDPLLTNDVLWIRRRGNDRPALERQVADCVRGRWVVEDGTRWLRPDLAARDAWDLTDAKRDDIRFAAAAAPPAPEIDVEGFKRDLRLAQAGLDRNEKTSSLQRIDRLSRMLQASAGVASAFAASHLGDCNDGEKRTYGSGARPLPTAVTKALRTLEGRYAKLLGPVSEMSQAATVLGMGKPGEDRVDVSRNGDSFTFMVTTRAGYRAFERIALRPDSPARSLGKIPLDRPSRLFLERSEGKEPGAAERDEIAEAVSDEPVRLVVPDLLAAQFVKEASVVALVPDAVLVDAASRGPSSLMPLAKEDFAFEREEGWLRVVPRRLGATSRARTDREAWRTLVARLQTRPSFELLEAAGWAATLHERYHESIARRLLAAIAPDLSVFYLTNDWRWMQALGGLTSRTLSAASDPGGTPVTTLPWSAQKLLKAATGPLGKDARLEAATSDERVFQIDLRFVSSPSPGAAYGVHDMTPERFGAFLAANDEYWNRVAKDGTLYRSEVVRLRVGKEEGKMSLRHRTVSVRDGDLSALDAEIRKRVEAGRSAASTTGPSTTP